MKRRVILAMLSAVALSACAANYPDLVVAGAPPPVDPAKPEEIDLILYQATALQNSYGRGYKQTAQWQDYSQLPIIGAAGYAAWVLLNNKANAATKVGKIGIVAGTYSEARGQLTASGLPDAYIAGHGALTCVLAEGSTFAGQPAKDREQELDDQLQIIANRIAEVTALRWLEPSNASQFAEPLKAARTVADQAIANARTAETAALAQQGAFRGAAPVFRNAVSSVSVRVASKGRVRPAVDFASLRDKFAPPKPPAEGTGQGALGSLSRNDAASVIERLMQATQLLVTETAQLTGGTPDYTGSLNRVRVCPDLVR
jgi:hypothetical protein